MADYAEGKGEPPPELKTAFLCKRWNTLPEAGGLYDQPAGLINRMTIAVNVYNAFTDMYKSENWAKYLEDNPSDKKIIDGVAEMRKNGRY